MRALNEHIDRQANAEDGVKGRFWEDRLKSQALLDEQVLLAAMAYVELNPVRAGIAQAPEASDYTSIQERIGGLADNKEPVIQVQEHALPRGHDTEALDGELLRAEDKVGPLPLAALMPFDAAAQTPWAIPFAFDDYRELVDWTGRAIRSDKDEHIPASDHKILDRLGIDPQRCIALQGAARCKLLRKPCWISTCLMPIWIRGARRCGDSRCATRCCPRSDWETSCSST